MTFFGYTFVKIDELTKLSEELARLKTDCHNKDITHNGLLIQLRSFQRESERLKLLNEKLELRINDISNRLHASGKTISHLEHVIEKLNHR